MAASEHNNVAPQDNFPYAEFDKLSGNLRQAAFELAEGMAEIEPRSSEINLVIKALTKINEEDIKVMDNALNNFKKALAGMVMRSTDSSIFGPSVKEEQMPDLMDKYTRFIAETIALSEKALDLEENE